MNFETPGMTTLDHLTEMVRQRNRGLAFDAALKAGLGIGFAVVTFGILYWFGWFVGFFLARSLSLPAWQFSAIFTGLFFAVATVSAWRRVDPMAGLQPLSDREMLVLLISQAAGGIGFSPRHASAGMALVLLGGPANVFEALGVWAHRIRADAGLLDEAARLLAQCETALPAEQVRTPAAAFLLKRLALIKVVRTHESGVLKLTEKGFGVLAEGGAKRKQSRANRGKER
jgi:hypothetical protein